MKNLILSIAVATTVASSVTVAAPITFKGKVGGAYNYTQYIKTKAMTDAIDQELAALNRMYETSMFEETPFGDTASNGVSENPYAYLFEESKVAALNFKIVAFNSTEVEMMTKAIDQEVAALNTLYETNGFEETPFGETATSGASQQDMYDLQFSLPVVQ